MSKRTSKAEGALLMLAIVVGLPIYFAAKVFEATGWVIPMAVVIGIIALVQWNKYAKKQRRLAYLRAKYHDEDVVQKINEGYFWTGQTQEQLRDSLGAPAAIDNKILKTMTREVWKYRPAGANRYRLRITVENGRVATWDQKN